MYLSSISLSIIVFSHKCISSFMHCFPTSSLSVAVWFLSSYNFCFPWIFPILRYWIFGLLLTLLLLFSVHNQQNSATSPLHYALRCTCSTCSLQWGPQWQLTTGNPTTKLPFIFCFNTVLDTICHSSAF